VVERPTVGTVGPLVGEAWLRHHSPVQPADRTTLGWERVT